MTGERRFVFRLALALGIPNPDAMLARMPFYILREWMEFVRLEPLEGVRGDLRTALVASTMANLWGRGKDDPAYPMEAFLLRFEAAAEGAQTEPGEEERAEMLLQKMIAANASLGGELVDLRPREGEGADGG